MTSKERILAVVNRLEENTTLDEAIYRLYLLKGIEEGLRDAEQGRVTDHDEFMAELEARYAEDEAEMVGKSKGRSRGNRKLHRSGQSKSRSKVHQPAKSVR